MLQGKCLCGDVTYEINNNAPFLYNCHCKDCRAFSGSSMAANMLLHKNDIKFSDGNNSLTQFPSSPNTLRCFCSSCGSSVYSVSKDNSEMLALHCGGIEDLPDISLKANFHTLQKCPWVDIDNNLTNHERSPS
jgi:hypothetical protein